MKEDVQMVQLNVAAYEANQHGGLQWAGRYDDEGSLVESVYADENGRLDIPTSGLWLVGYATAKPTIPSLQPRTEGAA